MKRQIVINSASSGKFREQTINGRPHVITDMVSIALPSVMNRIFYPEAAVREAYQQLDRVPAPASHPKVDGLFISAHDPVAVNAHNVGAFALNPRIENNQVVNDLAIDVGVAERDERGVEILRRIRNSERIGVSTGLNGSLMLVPGQYNGHQYEGIISNIQFDHVALLLDEPPAGETTYTLNALRDGDGVLVGNVDTSVNELRDKLSALVRGQFNPSDSESRYVWVVDILLDPGAVIVEISVDGAESLRRVPFELQDDGEPVLTGVGVGVERVVTYEPQDTDNLTVNTEEGEKMDKDKLILSIIANSGNTFTTADKSKLEAMTELELVNALQGAVPAPAVTIEQHRAACETAGLTVNSQEDAEALADYRTNREAFEAFKQVQATARAEKVERIVANSDMTTEDLDDWDDARLDRLANSLQPAQDYSGQGGAPVRTVNTRNDGGVVCADFQ